MAPNVTVGSDTLYFSTDDGESWRADSHLPNRLISSISVIDSSVYLMTNGGIFRSSDDGISWDPINGGVMDTTYPTILVKAGTNIIAATQENGETYLSTDRGTTWANVGRDFPMVKALSSYDSDVFAGTSGGVYLSTDDGLHWSNLNDTLVNIGAFAISGASVFAGRVQGGFPVSAPPLPPGGAFRSTDGGATWSSYDSGLSSYLLAYLPGPQVYSMVSRGSYVYAGADSGVYASSINGSGWTQIDDGLPEVTAWNIYSNDSSIFVGTEFDGILERPLSQVTSIIDKPSFTVPSSFRLFQNYPNPFNPTTTIKFDVARQTRVILDVYDVLGRVVATLVEGEESAGYHEVSFNGSSFASGVYFYRMSAGNFISVRKFLLLK